MGWAIKHIERLMAGETVKFRPTGASMSPRIESRQLCTVRPIADGERISTGDVVLCRVKGRDYLHLVSAVQGERIQISNNRGYVNGWITRRQVYGKLVSVDP